MSSHSRLGPVLALTLLLSACSAFPLATQASVPTPAGASPEILNTPTPTQAPPDLPPAPAIYRLQMMDAQNGWAWAASGQLLSTTDGGQTWTDRTPGQELDLSGSFFLDPRTAWLSFASRDGSQSGLLQTGDGGQTWVQVSRGPQNFAGPASILHFSDPMDGWMEIADIGAGNMYLSLSGTRDGGQTWATIPLVSPEPEAGLPRGTLHLCSICGDSLYYDPQRTIIVYGDMGSMESAGVVRTQTSFDLGKTWQVRNLALPQSLTLALVSDASPVFFDDRNGLLPVSLMETSQDGTTTHAMVFYATQDGGGEWSLLGGTLDNVSTFPQLQAVSARDLFILASNGLYASQDGAQSWQLQATNLDLAQTDSRSVQGLDFVDARHGWVLIQENDVTQLYRTNDGGTNWELLTPRLAPSEPSRVTLDTVPPTPTPETSPTPIVVFDTKANAERVYFAANATWMELRAAWIPTAHSVISWRPCRAR
jgi:photosystem II stability/assembly factor-like uncharacterized protein